jgi:hypothetical protein
MAIHPESQQPPTMFITTLSPLLFFAPDIHLRHLRRIWVDETVHEQAWKQFLNKVQDEWDKFLLPVRSSPEVCISPLSYYL